MKSNIHPVFYEDAQVVCACGNTFVTGSTKKNIVVEVCSKCHPLYTGEHRYVDTKGKVESFEKKREAAKKYEATRTLKKEKKLKKNEKSVKSLKELLSEI